MGFASIVPKIANNLYLAPPCRLLPSNDDDSALFVTLDVIGLVQRLGEKSNK